MQFVKSIGRFNRFRNLHAGRNGFILLCIIILLSPLANYSSAQKLPVSRKVTGRDKIQQANKGDADQNSTITYQLIKANDQSWGYHILVNNRVMIKQTTPPGMPGNNGFATKTGAEAVAKLVISKMKKGEILPTVTIDEMKKLKAI